MMTTTTLLSISLQAKATSVTISHGIDKFTLFSRLESRPIFALFAQTNEQTQTNTEKVKTI